MTSTENLPPIAGLWSRFEDGAASEVVEKLSPLPPEAPVVYHTLRGLALLDTGKPAESAVELKHVLTLQPENPVAQLFLVLALFQNGEEREAGELLTSDSLVLHPHLGFLEHFMRIFWPLRYTTSLGTWNDVAASPVIEDPFDRLFTDWEKSQSGNGDRTQPHAPGRRLAQKYFQRGIKAFHKERRSAARYDFARAYRIHPENETYAAHFAFLELLHNGAEAARKALEPLLGRHVDEYRETRDPGSLPLPDTLVCYAWSLHDTGNHREAIRALSLVEPEGPEDFGAYFVCACCWLMIGDGAAFRQAFGTAMDLYFIDTWEQLLRPFIRKTGDWLMAGGTKLPRGEA